MALVTKSEQTSQTQADITRRSGGGFQGEISVSLGWTRDRVCSDIVTNAIPAKLLHKSDTKYRTPAMMSDTC
jgi:hypothetical protein